MDNKPPVSVEAERANGIGEADSMQRHGYACGEAVTWLWTPRGGYGYTQPVPARVVAVGSSRVRIAAQLVDGGEKIVTVKPCNLRKAARTHTEALCGSREGHPNK